MVVNFEFLDDEPIENIITCMHFKVDKVVFFGYEETVSELQRITAKFLKVDCGVKSVEFKAVSRSDLQEIVNVMSDAIQKEISHNNKVYFDVTGGESLILVAFGMLSREFETSMHMYDVKKDQLIELENMDVGIAKEVERQTVKISLNRLIQLHGGVINYNLGKAHKDIEDPEFLELSDKVYQVAKKDWGSWGNFVSILNDRVEKKGELAFFSTKTTIEKAVRKMSRSLLTSEKVYEMLQELVAGGILEEMEHKPEEIGFRFRDAKVKAMVLEAGCILETYAFVKALSCNEECRVGVHLDWDGVIHKEAGKDVLNEVDVLAIKGTIPTFISCKSGKMAAHEALYTLYELETVANRFGGKYARKILVCAKELGSAYLERAKEMGIEVVRAE